MASRKKTSTTPRVPPPESQGPEWSDLMLVRKVGTLGARLHDILAQLPKSLNITRQDALDMYEAVDENTRLRSIPYWLFVMAACGIATLGLMINSPAVIIGAMLVSPLMAPIIGLGMGIAMNDQYLGFKSVLNLVISLVVAIATSALMTIMNPAREITSEILGRTHPTVLDLFVALFCGLVASLSSARSRGKTTLKDVAPGAAIGVALMPPVCVVGFGLGIGFEWSMMWGAFLLFITNLMAIVLVSSLFYYFIYDQYNTRRLIAIRAPARKADNDPFYNSRLKGLWAEAGDRSSLSKRMWFPALLILLIIYPLTSSFLFLKKKTDVLAYIRTSLETHEKKIGLHVVRGAESLKYDRNGVNGKIVYSSERLLPPDFQETLKKEIADKFSGYEANISMVRIADEGEMLALKERVLALDALREKLVSNEVRHAHALDLARTARDILRRTFPPEDGLILDLRVAYSPSQIELISADYVGVARSREAGEALERALRNALREGLKTDVARLELKRVGDPAGRDVCRAPGRRAVEAARNRIQALLVPMRINPYIGLKLRLHETVSDFARAEVKRIGVQGVEVETAEGGRCMVEYEYEQRARSRKVDVKLDGEGSEKSKENET